MDHSPGDQATRKQGQEDELKGVFRYPGRSKIRRREQPYLILGMALVFSYWNRAERIRESGCRGIATATDRAFRL